MIAVRDKKFDPDKTIEHYAESSIQKGEPFIADITACGLLTTDMQAVDVYMTPSLFMCAVCSYRLHAELMRNR